MKHKAQEKLDLLFSKIALRSKCKRKVKSDINRYPNYPNVFNDRFSQEVKLVKNNCYYTLQDLINCQLTVEHIEKIEYVFNLLKDVPIFRIHMGDSFDEILDLFKKQKEMWGE